MVESIECVFNTVYNPVIIFFQLHKMLKINGELAKIQKIAHIISVEILING